MDEFAAQGHDIVLKVVTGVSIGAINAACVVGAKTRADARARLDALWDDLMLEAPPFWMAAVQRDLAYFGLPGFYRAAAGFLDRADLDLCLRYPPAAGDARTPCRLRRAQCEPDCVRGHGGRGR